MDEMSPAKKAWETMRHKSPAKKAWDTISRQNELRKVHRRSKITNGNKKK